MLTLGAHKKYNLKIVSTQPNFGQVVTVTSLAFVVAQLNVSIVNLALPQITQGYHAGISTLQWGRMLTLNEGNRVLI